MHTGGMIKPETEGVPVSYPAWLKEAPSFTGTRVLIVLLVVIAVLVLLNGLGALFGSISLMDDAATITHQMFGATTMVGAWVQIGIALVLFALAGVLHMLHAIARSVHVAARAAVEVDGGYVAGRSSATAKASVPELSRVRKKYSI